MENKNRELQHYARLVAKKHFYLQYQSFHMEMKYLRHLGVGDYKLFYTRLSTLYLKRKLQLFKSLKLPRYKQDKTVEGILKQEFRSWQDELKRQYRRLEKARTFADHLLFRHHKVSKIYPLLIQGVLAFHPELEFARKNPGLTERWKLHLDAFYQGSIEGMKDLLRFSPAVLWSWNEIRRVILLEKGKAVAREIREIKSEGYFQWQEKLKRKEWVTAELNKLEQQTFEWERKHRHYYQELLDHTRLPRA